MRFDILGGTIFNADSGRVNMDNYTDINARTIDKWNENGWEWGIPISHEVFVAAQNGQWDVLLTPVKFVPHDWFRPFLNNERLGDARLLGLASGGGQQMPVFAALGAVCTVLDYSAKQLENERLVSEREKYDIEIVKADMTKPLPFDDGCFDIIFHPVSNCYIEDVYHVWNECYRVLKSGGVLLSGLDNGFSFIVEDFTVRPLVISGKLPFNPLKMSEEQQKRMIENDDGIQFSHTLDEQIGGQLKAGFILTDVYEDFSNDPDAIADGIPSFWASRAVKPVLMNGLRCVKG
jgi:SAM-dependent methyltransferase